MPGLLIAGVVLSGCAGGPPGDPTDLDQPLFGSNRETKFAMSTPSGVLKLRDVAAVAKTLRRYKTLDAAEKALVRLSVKRQIDALVALEVQRIAPKYEGERRRIQAIPDRRAAQQASAELDAKILREAASRVADRLANLVAVPVRATGNRSVVAFAKVADGQVQVADAAYEVDTPPGTVGPGTKVPLPRGAEADGVASLGMRSTASATILAAAPVPLNP